MIVRKLEKKDIPRVAELERLCFSDPWSERELSSCLENPFYVFLAAEEDGEVFGYAGMIVVLDEGNIANVAVAKEKRRRGFAEALLSELIREGEERGVRRYFLEVRESNLPAISLYEKKGFRRIGLRTDYYRNPRENALLYGKETETP